MMLFSLSILSFLVYRQKELLFSHHWQINWIYIPAALLLHGFMILVGAIAFASIMNTLGEKLQFSRHYHMFCVNMLTRRIPGMLWYVLYRNQTYQKLGYSVQVTSLASGVELAVSIVSGIIVSGIFGGTILTKLKLNPWIFIIIFLLGMLFLHPKILGWLMLKLGSNPDRFNYRQLVLCTGLYIILWISGGILLYLMINLVYPIGINQVGYLIGCWAIVNTVTQLMFFLPTNMGFSEVSLSLLFTTIMPSSIGVIVAILPRFVMILFESIWTGLSLLIDR